MENASDDTVLSQSGTISSYFGKVNVTKFILLTSLPRFCFESASKNTEKMLGIISSLFFFFTNFIRTKNMSFQKLLYAQKYSDIKISADQIQTQLQEIFTKVD